MLINVTVPPFLFTFHVRIVLITVCVIEIRENQQWPRMKSRLSIARTQTTALYATELMQFAEKLKEDFSPKRKRTKRRIKEEKWSRANFVLHIAHAISSTYE